jgi:hypothetical protein
METHIFEKQDLAVAERFAFGFRHRPGAIRGKANGFADEGFEFFRDGKKRKLGIRTTLGASEMRSED